MATRVAKRATRGQIERAMLLLRKANYDTQLIDSSFKRLGATMVDSNSSVESWLAAKTSSEIDMLLERLQHVTQAGVRDNQA